MRYVHYIQEKNIVGQTYREKLETIKDFANSENHELEIISNEDFLLLKDIMEQLIKNLN